MHLAMVRILGVVFLFVISVSGIDSLRRRTPVICSSWSTSGCDIKAVFSDRRSSTGWARLWIETSPDLKDEEQAYFLGYAEGKLTHSLINQFRMVIRSRHEGTSPRNYWDKQRAWINMQVKENADIDPFWYQAKLILLQMAGLRAGFNHEKPVTVEELSVSDTWLMNGDVENFDIESSSQTPVDFHVLSAQELIELASMHSRCSALVKWTGDDVIVGHATWEDFEEMNRVFKHITLNTKGTGSKSMAFSGYPGLLSSTDDFIVLKNGLVITETTINILKHDLYKGNIDPEKTVSTWMRCLIASRIASSGDQFIETLAQYNSGTNNDQWIVVDYSKVSSSGLSTGAIIMAELIPGLFVKEDITNRVIADGYWASFNRPYFSKTSELTMYSAAFAKHGEEFSYEQCPRAKIFKREQKNVHSIRDMKKVLRYNHFQTDEYSSKCPDRTIAARYDLDAPECKTPKRNNGAIDAKVVNKALAFGMNVWGISGPSADSQKSFSFSAPDTEVDRELTDFLPQTWDFNWVKMKPRKHIRFR